MMGDSEVSSVVCYFHHDAQQPYTPYPNASFLSTTLHHSSQFQHTPFPNMRSLLPLPRILFQSDFDVGPPLGIFRDFPCQHSL